MSVSHSLSSNNELKSLVLSEAHISKPAAQNQGLRPAPLYTRSKAKPTHTCPLNQIRQPVNIHGCDVSPEMPSIYQWEGMWV